MHVKILVETRDEMEQLIEQICDFGLEDEARNWRRKCRRHMVDKAGRIDLANRSGARQGLYVTIHDISPDGLGLLSPHSLRQGQKILVHIETTRGEFEIPAVVTHCTPIHRLFNVGVRFDLIGTENN